MPLSLQLLAPPTIEPVTLVQAKQWLRVDFDDDDVLIGALITAARQLAEKYTWRAFMPQVWQRSLDHFPLWWSENGTVNPSYRADWPYYADFWDRITIDLPRSAALGVQSITYLDVTGLQQTLDPSQYNVDLTSQPARIVPAQGTYWPTVQTYIPGAVKIVYAAGSYASVVADQLVIPGAAPYQAKLSQASALLPLTAQAPLISLTAATGAAVAYTNNAGVISVAATYAGQTLTARYCTTSLANVPQSVATAILMAADYLYNHRDAVDPLTADLPLVSKSLLAGERMQVTKYRP